MKKILIIIGFIAISISGIYAQNLVVRASGGMDSSNVFVAIKDSLKPAIIIDGIKYDYKILEIIDQKKISTMTVLKEEAALKEYNAPNGAILITTKAASGKSEAPGEIRIRATDNFNSKDPVIVIDGKVLSQEELKKLSPSDIESIKVLKGDEAMEKYNAPNGVIVVKTKK